MDGLSEGSHFSSCIGSGYLTDGGQDGDENSRQVGRSRAWLGKLIHPLPSPSPLGFFQLRRVNKAEGITVASPHGRHDSYEHTVKSKTIRQMET